MKSFFLTIFFLSLFAIAGNAQVQPSSSVRTGVLRVKLKAEDEHTVQAKRLSAAQGSTVSVGIKRLDALNKRFGVSEMQRVFPDAGAYEAKHRKYGLHLWYELVISDTNDPTAVAAAYKADGSVEQAEPVYKLVRIISPDSVKRLSSSSPLQSGIVRAATTNDTYLSRQWHYNNDGNTTLIPGSVVGADIRLFNAWDITMGSPNVIVCVIDGGVDYGHEDLAANMWVNTAEAGGSSNVDDDSNGYKDDIHGYNFYNRTGTVFADDHATHVAGTVAAVNANNKGVAGIAGGSGGGSGARIMSCQIFEANGNGSAPSAAPAFIYAADNGAVIAQNSWGYDVANTQDQATLDAIRYFIKEAGTDAHDNPRPGTPMVGGIVIFAAGNYSSAATYYPQAYPEVVAVAAVGPDGKKASYSNYGSWVDIAAPGGSFTRSVTGGVLSTYVGNAYGYDAGTSMACPHVSGVAALVLSRYGHSAYSPDSLRYRLLLSARSLSSFEPTYASQMGTGLLDAYQALRWISVTGITVSPVRLKMFVGQKAQLTATVLPSMANDKKVIWTSSNTKAIVTSNTGLLEAFSTGQSKDTATVIATTEDGKYLAKCQIDIYQDIIVPEGFSPNGDGHNDRFEMILDDTKTYGLRVFDKSGQLYYESADYKNDWDGTANTGFKKGAKIAAGTYYYVLAIKDMGLAKRGYLVVKY